MEPAEHPDDRLADEDDAMMDRLARVHVEALCSPGRRAERPSSPACEPSPAPAERPGPGEAPETSSAEGFLPKKDSPASPIGAPIEGRATGGLLAPRRRAGRIWADRRLWIGALLVAVGAAGLALLIQLLL